MRLWSVRNRRGDVHTAAAPAPARRVLIPFPAIFLYGMERAVLDLFDGLRPDVEPLFLVSRTAVRANLPAFQVIRGRGMRYARYSDFWSWPRLGKPRHAWGVPHVLLVFLLGNLDALRAARRADVLYVAGYLALYHSLLACLFIRLRGGQVVYDLHEVFPSRSRLLRLAAPLVTYFVNGSHFTEGRLRRDGWYIPAGKARLILRTVSRGANCDLPRETDRRSQTILYMGQIAPHKGVDLLVEAFNSVASDFPRAVLRIVGGASDAGYMARIEALVLAGGSTGRIQLHGYRDDGQHLLRDAYVYAQPSRPSLHLETAGLSVLEAMAAGVPAVVLPSGALAETVVHEETGLVCGSESSEDLAACLRRMLSDPGTRDAYGAAARARYERLYSPERMLASWRDLLMADVS